MRVAKGSAEKRKSEKWEKHLKITSKLKSWKMNATRMKKTHTHGRQRLSGSPIPSSEGSSTAKDDTDPDPNVRRKSKYAWRIIRNNETNVIKWNKSSCWE